MVNDFVQFYYIHLVLSRLFKKKTKVKQKTVHISLFERQITKVCVCVYIYKACKENVTLSKKLK